MKDIMSKLAPKPQPDDKYEAKMSVLNELRDMAMNMMGEKVKDRLPSDSHDAMKQVSSGYEHKLDSAMPRQGSNGSEMDKAAGDVQALVLSGRHEPIDDMGSEKQQSEYDSDGDMDDDMSPEEIDSMIEELQAKKAAKSSMKA